jgi:threonine/homoserine/homoserine lactone efflux protein
LRVGELPKALNYFGVVLGVAGLLSTVPLLFPALVFVFALGKIVWLIWLGIVMLRSSPSAAV